MSRAYSVVDGRHRYRVRDPRAIAALRQISRHPVSYGLCTHAWGSSRFTLGEVRTALGHVGARSRWRPDMGALLVEVSGAYYHGSGARLRTTRVGSALWAETRNVNPEDVTRTVQKIHAGDVVGGFADLREALSCRGQGALDQTTHRILTEAVQAALTRLETNPPEGPTDFYNQLEALRSGARDFEIIFPSERAWRVTEAQLDRYVSASVLLVRQDQAPPPYSNFDLISRSYSEAVRFSELSGVPISPEVQREIVGHQFSKYLETIEYFSSENRRSPDAVEAIMGQLLNFMRYTHTVLSPSAQNRLTMSVVLLENRMLHETNPSTRQSLANIRFILTSIVA